MVSSFMKQTWIVMGVLLNMLGQGMLLGHTSILLPSLQAPESDIEVDVHTASCIASAIGYTGIPGFLLSSLFMELYGRRLTHALVIVPGIVGWLCIYYAKSVPLLVIGRAFGGFTAAATVSLGAIVIGEYTSPNNRGMFLNLKTAAICFGNMAAHTLGYVYHWRTIALVALLPHIASLLLTCTWPESPAWLASKNKYKQSEISFFWLREKNEESTNEMEDLLRSQKERISSGPINLTLCSTFSEFLKKIKRKDFIKPIFIVIFGFILLEACGKHIFPAFALQIIEEVTGSEGQTFYYNLGMDITITASAIFSSVLIKLLKRRTLLFASGFTALFILYFLCGYLYLVRKGVFSSEITFIPIILFVVYFIVSNLGCTSIPLALLGEIFPLAHRGSGSCVAGFLLSILLTTGMQITPYLLVNAEVYGTFALLGTVMGLSLIVLWLVLPETKDRTLQEIEDYLNYGEFKDKVDDEAKLEMMPA